MKGSTHIINIQQLVNSQRDKMLKSDRRYKNLDV
jgi:hypothetical protein